MDCMPSIWCITSNCNILHLIFKFFFRQSVTKIMGKTAFSITWKRAKVATSYVMGSQHCIGGEGKF